MEYKKVFAKTSVFLDGLVIDEELMLFTDSKAESGTIPLSLWI